MLSDSIASRVCGVPTKAVETAAPWKPWKTQKAGFPPFPPRLENSPQKTRSEFSTVPTASAANIFSLKRELVSSRRTSCTRTWFAIAILRCNRNQAGRPAISLARRSRESFCLTSPFIERGQGYPAILETIDRTPLRGCAKRWDHRAVADRSPRFSARIETRDDLQHGMTYYPIGPLVDRAKLRRIESNSPSGSNSAVECDLAKVEVAGSNPVSRSKDSGAKAAAE